MKSAEKLKKINLLMDDKLLIKLGLIFFYYKLIYKLITTIYYTLILIQIYNNAFSCASTTRNFCNIFPMFFLYGFSLL